MPASLRSDRCSPSDRNAIRVPFGIRIHLHRNPQLGIAFAVILFSVATLPAQVTAAPAPPDPPPTAAIEAGQVCKEQSKPEFYLLKGGKKLWIPSM
ncbi:MAG TPA: hypothetical protein VM120_04675, partial [Bryobacteraceae bacterium]|nr:hypothetical protein [Bryobacteraceae bacterium]